METEVHALHAKHIWTLVPSQPTMDIIDCMWVYKIKQRHDGTIERYKSRLVAKRFNQQEGIDLSETFSPVAKASTMQTVLAVAFPRQWQISTMLPSWCLDEEVYMQQPHGFTDPVDPSHVCWLHKAIVLRQAPGAWFHRLSSFYYSLTLLALLQTHLCSA